MRRRQSELTTDRPIASVSIKGTRRGLSITLGEGDWTEVLRELDARLGEADQFFQGSRVNLLIEASQRTTPLGAHELQGIIEILQNHRVELASLQTGSHATAEAGQAPGMWAAQPELEATTGRASPGGEAETPQDAAIVVRRTLRSGQSLRSAGHIVVIGDVNPGAEVIAAGDVIVWGRLRGAVHAGALGDEQAIVCALDLSPTQLRIGEHIAAPSDGKKKPARPLTKDRTLEPEVAAVSHGQIIVQPWSAGSGGKG